jgi:hypothetical protein
LRPRCVLPVAAAVVLLAGCAATPVADLLGAGCVRPDPGTFQDVDWTAVRQIDIRVRQGDFTPNLVRMRQGAAYVLRINNRDDDTRRFNARDFFATLKIDRILVGDQELDDPCPIGLIVPPRRIVEIRFIADRDGRYEFADSILPPFVGAPDGILVVEEAAPPIAQLQLLPPRDTIPTFPLTPAVTPAAPPVTPAAPASPAAAPISPAVPAPEVTPAPKVPAEKGPEETPSLEPAPAEPAPSSLPPAPGGGLFGQ